MGQTFVFATFVGYQTSIRLPCLVATGASHCAVPLGLADRIGTMPLPSKLYQQADGRAVEQDSVEVPAVVIGGRSTALRVTSMIVALSPQPVVGLNALEQLHIRVDTEAQTIGFKNSYLGVEYQSIGCPGCDRRVAQVRIQPGE
jgi:predicted aspartyl protease